MNGDLSIQCVRLKSFLDNNQLVQANAISKKIQGMIKDRLSADIPKGTPMENHPLWGAYRITLRIESGILSGNRRLAANEAQNLLGAIS